MSDVLFHESCAISPQWQGIRILRCSLTCWRHHIWWVRTLNTTRCIVCECENRYYVYQNNTLSIFHLHTSTWIHICNISTRMRTHAPTLNNCRDKNSIYLNISQNKAQPLQKQCVASCIASFSPEPMGHPKMSPRDTSKRAQGILQKEPKGHLKKSPKDTSKRAHGYNSKRA